ncbi:MAG: hypothetical protein E7C50_00385 [Clostridium sp.]|uniref:hypothetical protein n=1 Tax=Clostridium sp. TaxID=1506 RepID=UPI0029050990|nr:hypothetical protein [Clostridium sp.]MDU2674221.1 hypothetical protein [Clostridium sp.]MDU2680316.1 hypothetical protein [Clostridium sp.]
MASKKKDKDKVKDESKKAKLAKKILENKGISFDVWIEEQYQNIIDENVDLLISSLEISTELEN